MLSDEEWRELRATFRTKDDCEERHDGVDDKINSIDKKVTTVSTKLSMLLGILGCIGAAVVAIAAKMFFGG